MIPFEYIGDRVRKIVRSWIYSDLLYLEDFKGTSLNPIVSHGLGRLKIGDSTNLTPELSTTPLVNSNPPLSGNALQLGVTGKPVGVLSIGAFVTPFPPGIETLLVRASFTRPDGPHEEQSQSQGQGQDKDKDIWFISLVARPGGVDDVAPPDKRIAANFRVEGNSADFATPNVSSPTSIPGEVYNLFFPPPAPGITDPEFTLELALDRLPGKESRLTLYVPKSDGTHYTFTHYTFTLPAITISAVGVALVKNGGLSTDTASVNVRDFRIYGVQPPQSTSSWLAGVRAIIHQWMFRWLIRHPGR